MILPDRRPSRHRATRNAAGARFRAALTAAPDRLVMLLFWTCLVVSLTVLFGVFRPVVVLPALGVVFAATWRLMPAAISATRTSASGALVAVVLAATWTALNWPFASPYVIVGRDPGFLTLEGFWLARHASPDIPVGAATDLKHQIPELGVASGPFYLDAGLLHAQGAKLVPGLLALGGWAGGDSLLLRANLLVGGLGLVAVYAMGRRLISTWWALIPVVALGLSLPMMVFSRAAYTEPIALVLVLGGLTMSWSAFETQAWWRHLLAGMMVGSSALARIDGGVSVIGLVAGVGFVAAVTVARQRRMVARLHMLLNTLGAVAMVGLGFADLWFHSPSYLNDLVGQYTLILGGVSAVAAVLTVTASVPWLDGLRGKVASRRREIAGAGAVLALVLAGVLVSRPFWMVNRRTPPDSGVAAVVAGLQEAAGVAIDPTRSYDEMSVSWLSLYFGWVAVAAGLAGIAYLAYRTLRNRDSRGLVVLAVAAAPSVLYLWQVSITPDQIWAMRRLLPVTIPALLLAAAVALHALWTARRRWLRWLSAVGAIAVALFPLVTWNPLLTSIEHDGRLDEAHVVCDAIAGNRVIFIAPGGPPYYLQTLRTICDVEVAEFLTAATRDDLITVRDTWGDDVRVVTFWPDGVPWVDEEVPAPLDVTETSQWGAALDSIPRTTSTSSSTVWVGLIRPDGTVAGIPPAMGS